MPAHDARTTASTVPPEIARALDRALRTATLDDVLAELTSLRAEVAALRAESAPQSLFLITGAEAAEEFRRLVRKG